MTPTSAMDDDAPGTSGRHAAAAGEARQPRASVAGAGARLPSWLRRSSAQTVQVRERDA